LAQYKIVRFAVIFLGLRPGGEGPFTRFLPHTPSPCGPPFGGMRNRGSASDGGCCLFQAGWMMAEPSLPRPQRGATGCRGVSALPVGDIGEARATIRRIV